METSDWILVISVGVALVIGVVNLVQTKNLEKKRLEHDELARQREHKRRMLNEVIDWATEMSKLSYRGDVIGLFEKRDMESVYEGTLMDLSRLSQLLGRAKSRNERIKLISSRLSEELKEAVSNLVSVLKENEVITDKCIDYMTENPTVGKNQSNLKEVVQRYPDFEPKLGECVVKVIEEAEKLM